MYKEFALQSINCGLVQCAPEISQCKSFKPQLILNPMDKDSLQFNTRLYDNTVLQISLLIYACTAV